MLYCLNALIALLLIACLSACLRQAADIYLIDEPSAYLDSEQRIIAAKTIKRFIMHAKKTAFIVVSSAGTGKGMRIGELGA